ncbi:iron-containing redox enzyme family protein [Nocardia transvalensis]|uniref:iron-containing redox enzyme family protein n=1 Tax=Nocardia transvalensis TaxID=37333 RepID=UPI001895933A|nr:iron-containing redox enzyme family protein [Nocardia transvalensis]MBF6329624.1 iron-containing redox enzyme family protein [Nocardia transvalensis]
MAGSTALVAQALPRPRGELSGAVVDLLRGGTAELPDLPVAEADPYGEDLQLALHTCYELHYHGFDGVDPRWEWDPGLLALRAELEDRFLMALRRDVPGGSDLSAELEQLLVEPIEATGIGQFLRDEGEWWHMREYFVHRSIYHHKEADPYAWVIPRLRGQAKAALVAVEFDEYGGGRGERIHARLFADLLDGAGVNSEYLHYLDVVPAPMLALVNMMSLFGLHRSRRGALVGHFATVEITSPPAARRMVEALRRLEADPACVFFYAEHVEADAVHEQVMRRDVIGDLLAQDPALTESVVFGIQATNLLETRLEQHILHDSWRSGRSSLRSPGLSE